MQSIHASNRVDPRQLVHHDTIQSWKEVSSALYVVLELLCSSRCWHGCRGLASYLGPTTLQETMYCTFYVRTVHAPGEYRIDAKIKMARQTPVHGPFFDWCKSADTIFGFVHFLFTDLSTLHHLMVHSMISDIVATRCLHLSLPWQSSYDSSFS
jgi:hypothetical protein